MAICHPAVANFCHLANNLPMANRIREVRRSKDVTLEALAEETGISTSYLSRIEGGSRKSSLENLIRIARALSAEPEELSDEFDMDDLERAKALPLSRPSGAGDVANLNIRAGLGVGTDMEVARDDGGQIYADHINGFWSFPDGSRKNFPTQ